MHGVARGVRKPRQNPTQGGSAELYPKLFLSDTRRTLTRESQPEQPLYLWCLVDAVVRKPDNADELQV